jgi:hypothetical protein
MNIQFEDNEFTSCELLKYLKEAYGLQINGAPFVAYTINNWIRYGKIPMAYGDHKILKVVNIEQFSNAKVLTLEGLTRDTLDDLQFLKIKSFSERLPKTKRPRKHRTRFYYQLLEKVGKQYTKKTLSILPDDWKQIGIKSNQLAKQRYKKVK